MAFALSQRSLSRLDGVHPDLVRVVKRAIELTAVDFAVTDGVRSLDKQKEYLAAGASTTLRSRHLPASNKCGMSCAVDLAAWVSGEPNWAWPLYHKINEAMQTAANELGVPIEWGGNWRGKFKDGPHFQLPWKAYP